jgi:hypothetical protein
MHLAADAGGRRIAFMWHGTRFGNEGSNAVGDAAPH